MEVKLKSQDDIKVPWEFQSLKNLYDHLKEERKEVDDAFQKYLAFGCDKDRTELLMELADEANICHMLFCNLHQVARHYRRGMPEPRLPRMEKEDV